MRSDENLVNNFKKKGGKHHFCVAVAWFISTFPLQHDVAWIQAQLSLSVCHLHKTVDCLTVTVCQYQLEIEDKRAPPKICLRASHTHSYR